MTQEQLNQILTILDSANAKYTVNEDGSMSFYDDDKDITVGEEGIVLQ